MEERRRKREERGPTQPHLCWQQHSFFHAHHLQSKPAAQTRPCQRRKKARLWWVVARSEDVLAIWCDFDALAARRELEILNELDAAPVLVILAQSLLLLVR